MPHVLLPPSAVSPLTGAVYAGAAVMVGVLLPTSVVAGDAAAGGATVQAELLTSTAAADVWSMVAARADVGADVVVLPSATMPLPSSAALLVNNVVCCSNC